MVETVLNAKIRRAKSSEPTWSLEPEPVLTMASEIKDQVSSSEAQKCWKARPEEEQEKNQDTHRQKIKRQSETRKH